MMMNTRINGTNGTRAAQRMAPNKTQRNRVGVTGTSADVRNLKLAPQPSFAGRKLIYVCSPFRPKNEDSYEALMEFVENLDRAHSACRLITNLGAVPVCPHIYFPQFMDDEVPEERELAMELALAALRRCNEVFVFSEHITEGMTREIAEASRRGIPVRMFCEAEGILADAIRKMDRDTFDEDEEDMDGEND